MSPLHHDSSNLLDQRAAAYAGRVSDASKESQSTLQVLLCSVGEHVFGLELHEVQSVHAIHGLVKVPHTFSGLIGVLHAENQLFSLFDTAELLQFRDVASSSYSHAVILHSETHKVALACTALLDLIKLDRSEVMDLDTFPYQQHLVVLYRASALLSQLDPAH